MALIDIPDMKYEINGDLINIEQGAVEPAYVSLHRIHLEHLAKEMNIGDVRKKAVPSELEYVLVDLREGTEELFDYLAGVPSFPPQDDVTDDVKMAAKLIKIADRACSIVGIETGNVPLLIDKELAEAISEAQVND